MVTLSVTDEGGAGSTPKAEQEDQEAERGRGLGMVSILAHRVVIHDSDRGHTVMTELFVGLHPEAHSC